MLRFGAAPQKGFPGMSQYRYWTAEEDAVVRQCSGAVSVRNVAERLGRSKRSVEARRRYLSVAGSIYAAWNDAEDEVLRAAVREAAGQGWSFSVSGSVAQRLGRSPGAVARRARKLGLFLRSGVRSRSGKHSGRKIVGFRKGSPVFEHRHIMEQHIGRALRPDEHVHHIDCDKDNNAIGNLYLCTSISEHRSIHHQINNLTGEILRRGWIRFDRTEGVYQLCETGS